VRVRYNNIIYYYWYGYRPHAREQRAFFGRVRIVYNNYYLLLYFITYIETKCILRVPWRRSEFLGEHTSVHTASIIVGI